MTLKYKASFFTLFMLLVVLATGQKTHAQTVDSVTTRLDFEINPTVDSELFHMQLIVNPFGAANDNGGSFSSPLGSGFIGNSETFRSGTLFGSERTDFIYELIGDIYGQVGIDVQFITPRTINDSEVNIGENAIAATPTFGAPDFVPNRPFSDGGDAATFDADGTLLTYSIDNTLATGNRSNTTQNVVNLLTPSLLPGSAGANIAIGSTTDGGIVMILGSQGFADPEALGIDVEAFIAGQTLLGEAEPGSNATTVETRIAQAFLLEEVRSLGQMLWISQGGGFVDTTDDNLLSDENNGFGGPIEGMGLSAGGILRETDLIDQLFEVGTQDDFIPINTAVWVGGTSSNANTASNWLSGAVPTDPRRPFVYNPFAAIFDGNPSAVIDDEIKTIDLLFAVNPSDISGNQVNFGNSGLPVAFHNITVGQGVNGALTVNGRVNIRNTTGSTVDTSLDEDLFPGLLNDSSIIISNESTIAHQGMGSVNFRGRIFVDDFRYSVEGESITGIVAQDTTNILNFDVGMSTGIVEVSGTIEDNSALSPLATTQIVKQGPGTLLLTGSVQTSEDFVLERGVVIVDNNVFAPPAPIDFLVGAPGLVEDRRLQAFRRNVEFDLDLVLSGGGTLEVGGGTPIDTTGLNLTGGLTLPAGTQLKKVGQNTVLFNSPGSALPAGTFVIDRGQIDATGAGAFPSLDFTVNGSSQLLLGDSGIDTLILTGTNFLNETSTFNGRTSLPPTTTLVAGTIIPAGALIPAGTVVGAGSGSITFEGVDGDETVGETDPLLVAVTLNKPLELLPGQSIDLTSGVDLNLNGLLLPEGTQLPVGTILADDSLFPFATPAAGGGFLLSGGRLQPGGIETIGDATVDSFVTGPGTVVIFDVAGGGLNDRVDSTALPLIDPATEFIIVATPGAANPVVGDAWDVIISDGAGAVTTPTTITTTPRWTLTPSNPSPEDLTLTLTDITGFSDPSFLARGIDPLFARYLDDLAAAGGLSGVLIPLIDATAALDPNPDAALVRIVNNEADSVKGVAGFSQSEFSRVSSFTFIQHLRSASRGVINEFTTPFEQIPSSFNTNEINRGGLLASRRNDPQILAASLEEGSLSAEEHYIPAIRPYSSGGTFKGLSIIAEMYTVYGQGTRRTDTPAYKGQEYGILVGAELGPFVFGENEDSSLAFGVALGYSTGDVKTGGSVTNSEFSTVRVANYLYGNIGEFAYLANFTVSNHELDLTRNALAGFHYGNTDAYDMSAYLEIGHAYPIRNKLTGPGWEIEPQAGILFQHYEQGAFNEIGPLPFSVSRFDQTTLSTRFGATIRSSLRKTLGIYTGVEGFAGWQHEYLHRKFAASYIDPTAVNGAARLSIPDRDKAYFGLNINLRLNENWSSFMRYEGNWGGSSHAHGFFGGLRFSQ